MVSEGRWQKRERIRAHLLDLVEETRVGAPIPGERQLCEELQVSRPTLRSVVDDLVRDGLLVREHGRGVFVARAKVAQQLTQGGGPALAPTGVDGDWTSSTVDFRSLPAGPRIGRRLQVSPAEEVLRITRLRYVDGDPMAVETLHVPRALVPGLTARDLENDSFYQLLGRGYGILLADAAQIIEPTVVDEAEAELLGVPLHAPALLLERTTRDADGRVVEFTRSVYRGDRYRILTQLSLAARADTGRVLGGSWSAASTVPGADTLVSDPYWTDVS
ncbi:GntR family transcriptional regulator [Streptacidiphilus sp. PB12-B1b]|uniref:GntR family transcriptional regulator n=1 Tax=Streptacidiphilus sp. PB12-B1b TaxID=2705012 RepID=UPI0015F7C844|nr:GntR family transcriptional regulator [Streptacidiphilus sp. PB12-B1b]QMU77928.1 GntR family transcriptional regulator [Streptacidiphilus sp. PB12-B1b]